MSERLQKILARHGLGSRREIERWIEEGRITVNLQPAKVGDRFLPGDRIAIDGKEVTARLSIEVAPQVLLFHKPQSQPIKHDSRNKQPPPEDGSEPIELTPDTEDSVLDRLPAVRGSRWIPINPMHAGDSGLLLLTNDGNLGYALTRRKRWIPAAYMVRVLSPNEATGEERSAPEIPPRVNYDSGKGNETVEFTSVEPAGGEGSNLWFRVESPRADHRAAVRALFESRDLKVSRMTQVAFGSIELPRDLPRGRHRALSEEQIAALYELARIAMPVPSKQMEHPQGARTRKPVAPDRRGSTKKKSVGAKAGTKEFEADAQAKRLAKQRPVKKESTWRVGGRKNRGLRGRPNRNAS